jgi:prepilin-type N-terminal cleavage/methylation domain-containing protein
MHIGSLKPTTRRAGFTLLEVLLAAAIGVILMGALYVAMSVQLRHAQAGRDIVEQSTLARAILSRMASDINGNLGPYAPPPQSGGQSGAQSSAGTTSSSTSSASFASASSSVSGTAQINLGVQGSASQLTLSVSRVSRELSAPQGVSSDGITPIGFSDLRLVTYWMAGASGSGQGLARLEYKPVTSDQALNSLPPNVPDEASCVIAEEVQGAQFSYFDGNAWQDNWDGTTLGPDGVTPIGPPVAVAIVLQIASPTEPKPKTYRHVVAIPTANNLAQLNAGGTQQGSTPSGSQ